MTVALLPVSHDTEILYLRLAREIAKDLNDIETILKTYQIEPKQWDAIKDDRRFCALLESEIADWNAAGNTHERTKLKAAALVEEFLVEANTRLHDRAEGLAPKTELLKSLMRIAGMGERSGDAAAGSGERFHITINLGADQKLNFVKTVTPKVIEGSAVVIDEGPLGDEEDA
jgi:hypothetical protein